MKFIRIILSLFLLGISVAPCTDTPATDNMEISFNTEGDHNHNDTDDHCSPLCVCHCCHSHLVVDHIELNDFDDLLFSEQTSSYLENITEGFLDFILQPPQA